MLVFKSPPDLIWIGELQIVCKSGIPRNYYENKENDTFGKAGDEIKLKFLNGIVPTVAES